MTERRAGGWVRALVTIVLAMAASVTVVFGVRLALDRHDLEPLESPLLMSVSHQLIRGPWWLYGPFDGGNPWVLIHGPLYYRLAALLAWPLVRAGLDPVTAALTAARSLSFLGLCGTMAAGYRIARLDGTPRLAGAWSAVLIAASLVVGVMPYAVRPDMMGVALQTSGVLLVLSVLAGKQTGRLALPGAYAAFGLAVCVKQHFIVGPLLSTLLLLTACARGGISARIVGRGLLTGLAIVLMVYGVEELVSAGRMSQAVFQAAASSGRVHPVGWVRAEVIAMAIVGKSAGLIAVLMAAGVAVASARSGIGRLALVVTGTGLVCAIAVKATLYAVQLNATGHDEMFAFGVYAAALFLFIPACGFLSPRTQTWPRLDRALALYLAAEFALVMALSQASAGSWINYGIQTSVFANILTARALARALGGSPGPVASAIVVLSTLILLAGVCSDARRIADSRRAEQLGAKLIIEHYGRPPAEFFFVDRPGINRVNGRLNLVYDNWLYPVFESVHLAQSRSVWLRQALTAGDVRFVVTRSDSAEIDGVGLSLFEMGYARGIKISNEFFVWKRSRLAESRGRR